MGNGRTGITWTNDGQQAAPAPRRWWVRAWAWLAARLWEPAPAYGHPPCERWAKDRPLVVISASLEWNVRQNALAEAVSVAESMLGATSEVLGSGRRIADAIRALMTDGPVLASNQMDDRVPSYFELATMYRDLWSAWAAEIARTTAAKEERDTAEGAAAAMRDALEQILKVSRCQNGCAPDDLTCATNVADRALAGDSGRTFLARLRWAEENRNPMVGPLVALAEERLAELEKVRAILHDAETTPAGAWAVELAAAKENAAGVAALLEEAEVQRLKANAALQSVRSDFVDRAVAVLNEALKASPEAITDLVQHRVECRDELKDHPTVQVGRDGVGMLGVINGILGLSTEGFGPVTAVVDTDSKMVATFQRSVLANRGALGVAPDPLQDLATRADLAEQEAVRMKMRAITAEEALASMSDSSDMYREAWAAMGAPECGLLKWRSVLDGIEGQREERDQAKKDLGELIAILAQHVRDESAAETLKRLVQEHEERGQRLNTLLSMLGPRCGETGVQDERAEGALRRLLDERGIVTMPVADPYGGPPTYEPAPVVASLFPRAKAVLAAALAWFDSCREDTDPAKDFDAAEFDGAARVLFTAVEEWIRRGPDPKAKAKAAALVDEAEARARRELVETANLPAIVCDPRVFRGKPILRGARLAVEHLLGMMSAGDSVDDLLKAYPKLHREDVLSCLKVGRLAVERLTRGTHEERARCARIARTLDPGDEGPAGHAHGLAIAQAIEAGGAA